MKNGLIYMGLTVVAAATGFLIFRFIAPPTPLPEAPAAPIETSGTIPDRLPDFTLADRNGEPRSIRSWPDRSMIVNFWATWCAPCRREIPLLKRLQSEYAEQGFQVVGVAVDFRDDVLAYADEIGIDYPLLIGEEDGLDAVNAFGIAAVGFPFTAFTDAAGRIVTLHLGELTEPQANVILDTIQQVNDGELTVPEARTRVAEGLATLDPSSG